MGLAGALLWPMIGSWLLLMPATVFTVWWIRATAPDGRPVSHAAVPPRRAMPRYRRKAIRPAPLKLARPVSRVTAVSVQSAKNAKVKR